MSQKVNDSKNVTSSSSTNTNTNTNSQTSNEEAGFIKVIRKGKNSRRKPTTRNPNNKSKNAGKYRPISLFNDNKDELKLTAIVSLEKPNEKSKDMRTEQIKQFKNFKLDLSTIDFTNSGINEQSIQYAPHLYTTGLINEYLRNACSSTNYAITLLRFKKLSSDNGVKFFTDIMSDIAMNNNIKPQTGEGDLLNALPYNARSNAESLLRKNIQSFADTFLKAFLDFLYISSLTGSVDENKIRIVIDALLEDADVSEYINDIYYQDYKMPYSNIIDRSADWSCKVLTTLVTSQEFSKKYFSDNLVKCINSETNILPVPALYGTVQIKNNYVSLISLCRQHLTKKDILDAYANAEITPQMYAKYAALFQDIAIYDDEQLYKLPEIEYVTYYIICREFDRLSATTDLYKNLYDLVYDVHYKKIKIDLKLLNTWRINGNYVLDSFFKFIKDERFYNATGKKTTTYNLMRFFYRPVIDILKYTRGYPTCDQLTDFVYVLLSSPETKFLRTTFNYKKGDISSLNKVIDTLNYYKSQSNNFILKLKDTVKDLNADIVNGKLKLIPKYIVLKEELPSFKLINETYMRIDTLLQLEDGSISKVTPTENGYLNLKNYNVHKSTVKGVAVLYVRVYSFTKDTHFKVSIQEKKNIVLNSKDKEDYKVQIEKLTNELKMKDLQLNHLKSERQNLDKDLSANYERELNVLNLSNNIKFENYDKTIAELSVLRKQDAITIQELNLKLKVEQENMLKANQNTQALINEVKTKSTEVMEKDKKIKQLEIINDNNTKLIKQHEDKFIEIKNIIKIKDEELIQATGLKEKLTKSRQKVKNLNIELISLKEQLSIKPDTCTVQAHKTLNNKYEELNKKYNNLIDITNNKKLSDKPEQINLTGKTNENNNDNKLNTYDTTIKRSQKEIEAINELLTQSIQLTEENISNMVKLLIEKEKQKVTKDVTINDKNNNTITNTTKNDVNNTPNSEKIDLSKEKITISINNKEYNNNNNKDEKLVQLNSDIYAFDRQNRMATNTKMALEQYDNRIVGKVKNIKLNHKLEVKTLLYDGALCSVSCIINNYRTLINDVELINNVNRENLLNIFKIMFDYSIEFFNIQQNTDIREILSDVYMIEKIVRFYMKMHSLQYVETISELNDTSKGVTKYITVTRYTKLNNNCPVIYTNNHVYRRVLSYVYSNLQAHVALLNHTNSTIYDNEETKITSNNKTKYMSLMTVYVLVKPIDWWDKIINFFLPQHSFTNTYKYNVIYAGSNKPMHVDEENTNTSATNNYIINGDIVTCRGNLKETLVNAMNSKSSLANSMELYNNFSNFISKRSNHLNQTINNNIQINDTKIKDLKQQVRTIKRRLSQNKHNPRTTEETHQSTNMKCNSAQTDDNVLNDATESLIDETTNTTQTFKLTNEEAENIKDKESLKLIQYNNLDILLNKVNTHNLEDNDNSTTDREETKSKLKKFLELKDEELKLVNAKEDYDFIARKSVITEIRVVKPKYHTVEQLNENKLDIKMAHKLNLIKEQLRKNRKITIYDKLNSVSFNYIKKKKSKAIFNRWLLKPLIAKSDTEYWHKLTYAEQCKLDESQISGYCLINGNNYCTITYSMHWLDVTNVRQLKTETVTTLNCYASVKDIMYLDGKQIKTIKQVMDKNRIFGLLAKSNINNETISNPDYNKLEKEAKVITEDQSANVDHRDNCQQYVKQAYCTTTKQDQIIVTHNKLCKKDIQNTININNILKLDERKIGKFKNITCYDLNIQPFEFEDGYCSVAAIINTFISLSYECRIAYNNLMSNKRDIKKSYEYMLTMALEHRVVCSNNVATTEGKLEYFLALKVIKFYFNMNVSLAAKIHYLGENSQDIVSDIILVPRITNMKNNLPVIVHKGYMYRRAITNVYNDLANHISLLNNKTNDLVDYRIMRVTKAQKLEMISVCAMYVVVRKCTFFDDIHNFIFYQYSYTNNYVSTQIYARSGRNNEDIKDKSKEQDVHLTINDELTDNEVSYDGDVKELMIDLDNAYEEFEYEYADDEIESNFVRNKNMSRADELTYDELLNLYTHNKTSVNVTVTEQNKDNNYDSIHNNLSKSNEVNNYEIDATPIGKLCKEKKLNFTTKSNYLYEDGYCSVAALMNMYTSVSEFKKNITKNMVSGDLSKDYKNMLNFALEYRVISEINITTEDDAKEFYLANKVIKFVMNMHSANNTSIMELSDINQENDPDYITVCRITKLDNNLPVIYKNGYVYRRIYSVVTNNMKHAALLNHCDNTVTDVKTSKISEQEKRMLWSSLTMYKRVRSLSLLDKIKKWLFPQSEYTNMYVKSKLYMRSDKHLLDNPDTLTSSIKHDNKYIPLVKTKSTWMPMDILFNVLITVIITLLLNFIYVTAWIGEHVTDIKILKFIFSVLTNKYVVIIVNIVSTKFTLISFIHYIKYYYFSKKKFDKGKIKPLFRNKDYVLHKYEECMDLKLNLKEIRYTSTTDRLRTDDKNEEMKKYRFDKEYINVYESMNIYDAIKEYDGHTITVRDYYSEKIDSQFVKNNNNYSSTKCDVHIYGSELLNYDVEQVITNNYKNNVECIILTVPFELCMMKDNEGSLNIISVNWEKTGKLISLFNNSTRKTIDFENLMTLMNTSKFMDKKQNRILYGLREYIFKNNYLTLKYKMHYETPIEFIKLRDDNWSEYTKINVLNYSSSIFSLYYKTQPVIMPRIIYENMMSTISTSNNKVSIETAVSTLRNLNLTWLSRSEMNIDENWLNKIDTYELIRTLFYIKQINSKINNELYVNNVLLNTLSQLYNIFLYITRKKQYYETQKNILCEKEEHNTEIKLKVYNVIETELKHRTEFRSLETGWTNRRTLSKVPYSISKGGILVEKSTITSDVLDVMPELININANQCSLSNNTIRKESVNSKNFLNAIFTNAYVALEKYKTYKQMEYHLELNKIKVITEHFYNFDKEDIGKYNIIMAVNDEYELCKDDGLISTIISNRIRLFTKSLETLVLEKHYVHNPTKIGCFFKIVYGSAWDQKDRDAVNYIPSTESGHLAKIQDVCEEYKICIISRGELYRCDAQNSVILENNGHAILFKKSMIEKAELMYDYKRMLDYDKPLEGDVSVNTHKSFSNKMINVTSKNKSKPYKVKIDFKTIYNNIDNTKKLLNSEPINEWLDYNKEIIKIFEENHKFYFKESELVKLILKQQWTIIINKKFYGSKNIEHVVGEEGIINVRNIKNNRVYIGSEKVNFCQAIAIMQNISARKLYKNKNQKHTHINGAPGCGKTTYIKSKYKEGDMILVPTIKNKEDYLKLNVEKMKVLTIDSFLINDMNAQCEVLYIDEAVKVHSGLIEYLKLVIKCKEVYTLGDTKQIKFMSRIAEKEFFHNEIKVKYTEEHNYTYRCPYSHVVVLRKFYPNLECRNDRQGSIKVVHMSTNDKPPKGHDMYLTFTQFEKSALVSYGYNNSATAGEFQGEAADDVAIVRYNTKDVNPLYDDESQIIVLCSRSKNKLTYYTTKNDKLESLLLNRPRISKTIYALKQTCYIKMNSNNYANEYDEQVTCKLEELPRLDNNNIMLRLDTTVNTVEYSSTPISISNNIESKLNTTKVNLNEINELSSKIFGKDIQQLAEIEDEKLMIPTKSVKLVYDKFIINMMKRKNYDNLMVPKLISDKPVYKNEHNVVIKNFEKRNVDAPYVVKATRDNKYDKIVKTVLDTVICKNKLRKCFNERVYNNTTTTASWVMKRTATQMNTLLSDLKYNPKKYMVFMKKEAKPDVNNEAEDMKAANQMVIQQQALEIIKCVSFFNTFKYLITNSLKDNFIIYEGMNNEALASKLSKVKNLSGYAKLLDFARYDKSQMYECFYMMCSVLKYFKIPDDIINEYFTWNAFCKFILRKEGMHIKTIFMKKSGELMTYISNTIINLIMVVYVEQLTVQNTIVAIFGGDDNVIVKKDEFMNRSYALYVDLFNMEVKNENIDNYIYFCSRFLMETNRGVKLIADPFKKLKSLTRFLECKEHLDCYYTSYMDATALYENSEIYPKLIEVTYNKYKVSYNITKSDIEHIINFLITIRNKEEFEKLYTKNKDYYKPLNKVIKEKLQKDINFTLN